MYQYERAALAEGGEKERHGKNMKLNSTIMLSLDHYAGWGQTGRSTDHACAGRSLDTAAASGRLMRALGKLCSGS